MTRPAPPRSANAESDRVNPWVAALNDLGEYTALRFGRITPEAETPEWHFLPEADFDGIGAFAGILRERGANLPRLPRIRHPARPFWRLTWLWLKCLAPGRAVAWSPIEGKTASSSASEPPTAIAWHLFDETETQRILRVCRRERYGVNAFLLRHLTRALRPSLLDASSPLTWVIPVNLRGQILRRRDTANHSSYVRLPVGATKTTQEVHHALYRALQRGEHWAEWHLLHAGRFLGARAQKALLRAELPPVQRNAGTFTNLGDWDPDKQIPQRQCAGPWLFCPPVLRSRPIGAGAVTFQNRLSLAIQVHPELTTSSNTLWIWMRDWVKEIQVDLASIL